MINLGMTEDGELKVYAGPHRDTIVDKDYRVSFNALRALIKAKADALDLGKLPPLLYEPEAMTEIGEAMATAAKLSLLWEAGCVLRFNSWERLVRKGDVTEELVNEYLRYNAGLSGKRRDTPEVLTAEELVWVFAERELEQARVDGVIHRWIPWGPYDEQNSLWEYGVQETASQSILGRGYAKTRGEAAERALEYLRGLARPQPQPEPVQTICAECEHVRPGFLGMLTPVCVCHATRNALTGLYMGVPCATVRESANPTKPCHDYEPQRDAQETPEGASQEEVGATPAEGAEDEQETFCTLCKHVRNAVPYESRAYCVMVDNRNDFIRRLNGFESCPDYDVQL